MSQKDNILMKGLRETAIAVVPRGGHVWLYGSRARGDAHEDSDWDLLILVDKDEIASEDEDDISYPFVMTGWKNAAAVSPLLYTYKDWEQRMASPFYNNVERDKVSIL